MNSTRSAILALALLGAGCQPAGPEETAPDINCDAVTVPTYSQLTILDSCNSCHSSQLSGVYRRGAPDYVNYDTYEAAVDEAYDGAIEINIGTMPFTGTATDEEKQAYYAWALCGTPR